MKTFEKLINIFRKIKNIIIVHNEYVELEATDYGFNIKKFTTYTKFQQYDFTSEELEKLYLEHQKLIKNK